ncbi:MAG: type II methionyl aminopeptidase [Candidatus Aenigmarchaeota archaeon]|nr:type II methionyl aminopeptidase [Candidatus Aenigmarchaeota archaeon]
MDQEIKEKYLKAGSIAKEVREASTTIVKPGIRLLEIAEQLESMIRAKGGELAFPVNISINDEAAHYTPFKNDPKVIPEGAVVKIDLGVHIDGYVADTAHTLVFDDMYRDLEKASRQALEEALKLCTPQRSIDEISTVIEQTITSLGFKPIHNLTGHGLEPYVQHAYPSIPNVNMKTGVQLEEGMVVALEPFATTGNGAIKESEPVLIFSLQELGPVRNPDARMILSFAQPRQSLPFAERWIPIASRVKTRLALRELVQRGLLAEYPVLKEVAGGIVSQTEHTVLVADQPIITT